LSSAMLDRAQLFFDRPIHLLLMVVVIRQATVNLSERQVRVLALDFIGIPVVRQTVECNLNHLCLGPNKPNVPIGAFLDVGIAGLNRHV
jgi:hypothetical protein